MDAGPKLLLKRHPPTDPVTGQPISGLTKEQEEAFPASNQLVPGELAINTITGKLYTKLLDGSVVEFVSQKICFEPIPEIYFYYENKLISSSSYLVENFCCSGGLLTVVIDKLKLEPMIYKFVLQELTNNSRPEEIVVQPTSYSIDSVTNEGITTTYRKATVPISLKLVSSNVNNISLFQFKILDANDKTIRGSERILTIRCLEAK
jgi:hypothetical protein